jgi:hypothetical protein
MRRGRKDDELPPGDDGASVANGERSIIDELIASVNREADAHNVSRFERVRRSVTPRRVAVALVVVAVVGAAWTLSPGLAIAIAVVVVFAIASALVVRPAGHVAVHGVGSYRYRRDRAPTPKHPEKGPSPFIGGSM